MTFREFVDSARDAGEALIAGRRADRSLTPMVLLDADDTINAFAIEPEFFESSERKRALVEGFIVPMVLERRARKVAWICTVVVRRHYGEVPSLLVVGFDGECEEAWIAPLIGEGIGAWCALAPNESDSIFIQPIQEALR